MNPMPQAGWLHVVTRNRVVYIFVCGLLVLLCLRALHFPSSSLLYAAVLCAALLPRAVLESCQGILRGSRQFLPLPVIDAVQGAVLLGVAAGLLVRGHGLAAVVVAECAANLAGLGSRRCFRAPRWQTSVPLDWTLTQLLRRTFAFNLYPFIASAYDRLDVFVLARLAGSAAVGVYSMSYRVLATVLILPYGIMGALLPVLARSGWNSDKTACCSRTMRLLYSVALFVIISTNLLATPVIRLVLGAAYERSSLLLRILIWATMPMFLNFALNTTLLAVGREKVFLITATLCSVFNLAANVTLVPRFSNVASAAITVATELLLFGLNLFFVQRTLGRVPLPQRIGTLTMVSLGLLIGAKIAETYAPELVVAGVTLVLFSGYLIFDNIGWIAARPAVNNTLDAKS